MTELNDNEKKVIKMMFKSLSVIVEACGGAIEVDYTCFGRNDLYRLFEKINIGDYWD